MLLSYLLIRDHSPYLLVRAFSILWGGIFSVWVGSSREKLERQQSEIETILSLMPPPWLLVDSSGNLLRISPELQKLFGNSHSNLINILFAYEVYIFS